MLIQSRADPHVKLAIGGGYEGGRDEADASAFRGTVETPHLGKQSVNRRCQV